MRTTSSQKNKNSIVFAGILIVVLAAVAVFTLLNKKASPSSQSLNNESSIEQIDTNSESLAQSSDLSQTKIYFSIANSPSDKLIRKTYTGISSIEVDTLINNPPTDSGKCSVDIYLIEGVYSTNVKQFSFSVNSQTTKASQPFDLKSGMYRADVSCDFGGKKYSEVYTLDIKINNPTQVPASYSI